MVNVAVLGFGVVGSGVAEVLATNGAHIDQKVDDFIRLKYILDVREFPDSPFAEKVVHDFSVIEQDPEVSIVVETIGGAKAAKEFTERALRAGKSVVTSNKELVASHGYELLQLAKEHNVSYLFEASVGGGIPIIRPLSQCLAANEIEEICGILNGTTNYILTRMVEGGVPFDEALREAQEKGYAEANPAADIEGLDAGRKICILSDLAWGGEVRPEAISVRGISGLSLEDVDVARTLGCRIKLLGRALRLEDGRTAAYVAPHLVPESSPLSGVDGVFNAVMIRGNAVGDVMLYGRGAGDLPTASAVMGDVLDALAHREKRRSLGWSRDAVLADLESELPMRWYIRGEGPARITGAMTAREARALAGQAAALLPVLE